MADFTQSFLGGVQAGQQRLRMQQEEEQRQEENRLKKMMLKHQMDRLKIEDEVRARKTAFEEAGQMANFDQPAAPPSPQAVGQAAIGGAQTPPPPAPTPQPPSTVEVNIPGVTGGPAPTTVQAPTKTGRQASVLDAFNQQQKSLLETEKAKRALPPTQDQIIDNARLAQQAADAKEARKQSLIVQMMNAQSIAETRRLTAEIAKQNLEIAKARLQLARDTAARTDDPQSAQYLAEAVLTRRTPYRELDRFQRASVTEVLADMGMPIPRELTAPEKANQQKAESALISTEAVQDIIAKNPQVLALAIVPGVLGGNLIPGVANLRFHLGEMMDVKTRDRTGAALNQMEIKFYGDQAPQPSDLVNPEVIQTKINHFIGLNLAQTGRPVKLTSPDGKDTFIVTDGYDPNQRAEMRRKINQSWKVEPYTFEFKTPAAAPAADTTAPTGTAPLRYDPQTGQFVKN